MSNTHQPVRDDAALAPLLHRVAQGTGTEQAEVATGLARAAYRRFSAERLDDVDLESAAARIVDAASFVDGRRSGTLALRVFNPSVEEHGWVAEGTVVEVNAEDGPFLLSTVTEELAALDLHPSTILHPIVGVDRAEDGTICAVGPARHAPHRESWLHLELSERLDDERLAHVEQALRAVLADALRATGDFAAMKDQVEAVAERLRITGSRRYADDEVAEAMAFLSWLLDDHFVLLGYREYDLLGQGDQRAVAVRHDSGLGILRDAGTSSYAEPVALADLPDGLRERVEGGDLLVVSRTNRLSTVHRRERMIYVGLKKLDEDGTVVGESRFLGLFAQKAYAEPASAMPVLRHKLARILELEDFVDHSHDERTARALFESLPKHELFAAATAELRMTLVELLETQRRHDVTLIVRRNTQNRSVSVLVALPRERFNAAIRRRVQRMLLDRFGGKTVDYHLSMSEREQALMHFVVHPDRGETLAEVGTAELRGDVATLTRTWEDDFAEALAQANAGTGEMLAGRYGNAFAPGYRETVAPHEAVGDVAELERLSEDQPVRMRLVRRRGDLPDLLRFKLYKQGEGIELSAFLPILESLGLVGVEEVPHIVEPTDSKAAFHIHDFGVRAEVRWSKPIDLDEDGPRVAAAAEALWAHRAEADSLNRLVLGAGMAWDEVAVLRAYRRYRRQVGTAFTETYQNEALCERPQIAAALVELFAQRFDPDRAGDDAAVERARDRVLEGLDELERLDQDRILRGYLALIDATTRTNRYVQPSRTWLSLKLDSARVPGIPKPVPYADVFVYAPAFEGVHLRGGPVARGGLRWSDRVDDFRTEVLGLMKAQMLKNAVIVPTGAKGGFVLKRPPAGGPDAVKQEVRRQYESYVRGLLDVTDNVVEGRVVAPDRVRRADGDDPYLVVAADRGTATFSDLANAVSEEYGFWLGDAFASGGSRGYDHKEMGITARGTWVAVQRHFRELDIDVQTEPIRVVGIGDMSGDVFGNGMLQSRAIQLVAAFDHRDIFVDPDPDAERSYTERQRLYDLPGSSWQDYDRELLSAGGGVWSRSVIEIPLSDEIRRLLRVDAAAMSPPDLIRAILGAPTDLLFAGGVGTFVKASTESHADVGDRANDAVRVDADRLGARVVGEGGNLSVTQRGRIQYARRGGRINLDAIDNSAGVDTSDREVNLKILLQQAADDGRVDGAERDAVLGDVTSDVADAVLRDVYLQTWAISQELAFSAGGMEAYEQLMVDLERAGRLDREVEALPSTAEMTRRAEAGAGLTRPEVAVLLGYSKPDLRTRLLRGDLADQPALRQELEAYFPSAVTRRFGELLGDHRLRRELIVTMLANDIVNRMGVTYVSRTAHELGAMAAEIAGSYWIAREVAGAGELWRAVGALDGQVEPSVQLQLKLEVDRLIDAYVRTYVRRDAHVDLAAAVRRDRPAFQELEKVVAGGSVAGGSIGAGGSNAGGSSERRSGREQKARGFVDAGVEAEVAERFAALGDVAFAPDVAAVARDRDQPVSLVAQVFFTLSTALPFDRVHQRLQSIGPEGHWERWQHRGLADELRELRRVGAYRAIDGHPDVPGEEAVRRFLQERSAGRDRALELVRMLDDDEQVALPAVAVVVRALREVLASA